MVTLKVPSVNEWPLKKDCCPSFGENISKMPLRFCPYIVLTILI